MRSKRNDRVVIATKHVGTQKHNAVLCVFSCLSSPSSHTLFFLRRSNIGILSYLLYFNSCKARGTFFRDNLWHIHCSYMNHVIVNLLASSWGRSVRGRRDCLNPFFKSLFLGCAR